MAEATIPVDLLNPGQVFACLGFMEAAEILLENAWAGFDRSDGTKTLFRLAADGGKNPFEVVLKFLTEIEPKRLGPVGYSDPPATKGQDSAEEETEVDNDDIEAAEAAVVASQLELSSVFPAKMGERMTLPIRFGSGEWPVVELEHWADGSDRESFKLYAGNRSAHAIARAMLSGVNAKPTRKQREKQQPVNLKSKGIRQLWDEDSPALVKAPFDVCAPMGGSFNFDPRGGWTAIDAGYSPDKHKHAIEASPVVEFLAAWGLQNARPVVFGRHQVTYAVWGCALPPLLARAAFAGGLACVPSRRFRFDLGLSGRNKVVTFAQEEPHDIAHR